MWVLPQGACAQPKVPVIGLLWNDSVRPSPFVATLLGALGERGYAVGRDLRIEDRVSLEGYGGYAEGLADLVRSKVDLIVTYGATATHAAAKATRDIPIVMVIGTDPVADGLAASFARPGRNLTGVHTLGGDTRLIQKRLELLKELAPDQKRIGVMLARNVGNPTVMGETKAAARTLNLDVRFAEAGSPGEIEDRLAELIRSGSGAIYVTASTMLASRAQQIVEAIARHRVPAIYSTERYVDAGGVMTYSASIRKAFVRAGVYVERILKGAHPGELAIEQVSDVELVLNMKTANTLGLKFPQSILMRADRVIQ